MTNEKAIDLLRRMQEPEAYEPQITEEAFEALELAIRALGTDTNVGTKDVPDTKAGKLIKKEDVLGWLLAYHTESFKLKARYAPHEVISWVINDISKNLFGEVTP